VSDPDVDVPKGWARLPRWQHLALIVLCSFGLVAAIVNVVATAGGDRLLHLLFGLLDGAVLATLVNAYWTRPAQ